MPLVMRAKVKREAYETPRKLNKLISQKKKRKRKKKLAFEYTGISHVVVPRGKPEKRTLDLTPMPRGGGEDLCEKSFFPETGLEAPSPVTY